MTIGQYLKQIRTQRGLTIRDVADKSGGHLDKTTISRIERDERGISLKAAYALSRIYSIGMDELVEVMIGKAIDLEESVFETSDDERELIRYFRIISRQRRRYILDAQEAWRFSTTTTRCPKHAPRSPKPCLSFALHDNCYFSTAGFSKE